LRFALLRLSLDSSPLLVIEARSASEATLSCLGKRHATSMFTVHLAGASGFDANG
jgi:hypothetical protein